MATRTQEEWNKILTAIRDSGIINMWGAPRYLQDEYGISKKKSIDVFSAWKLTVLCKRIVRRKVRRRVMAEDNGEYPMGFWIEDVQSLFDVSDEEAEEFLSSIESGLTDWLIEQGWDYIRNAGVDADLRKKEESHG